MTRNELAKLRLATLIANYSYSRSSQSRIFKNHYETINKNMPDCGERRKVFRTKNCRFKRHLCREEEHLGPNVNSQLCPRGEAAFPV